MSDTHVCRQEQVERREEAITDYMEAQEVSYEEAEQHFEDLLKYHQNTVQD